MKPDLIKVISKPNESFGVRQDIVPYFYARWHFHPEIELVHIKQGSGVQYTGEHISNFKEGDIILIGANLPHYWKCDDVYFEKDSALKAIANVVHFKPDFWGRDFLDLPENSAVKDLLLKAKKGISIKGAAKPAVAAMMERLMTAQGCEKIVLLLGILNLIAQPGNHETIATIIYEYVENNRESERLNAIYQYTAQNFSKKITLNTIAKVANITPNSFCRYFKAHTRKNYNLFLMELRVGHACKLLIENKLNLTQICYKSGFNNPTSFYSAFKRIMGKTPLEYQQYYIKELV